MLSRLKTPSRIPHSFRGLFATYILLAWLFLAALGLGTARTPRYTEGEESMRKMIDSLAKLKYSLILIICDGMIVGSGNDCPTPVERILTMILGF